MFRVETDAVYYDRNELNGNDVGNSGGAEVCSPVLLHGGSLPLWVGILIYA
jgi:hypothetical protein